MDTVKGFFKVFEVAIDCAVPLPRLFKDIPANKEMITARCPFTEASLLFTTVLLQGGSQALLYDLNEDFACETQECYAPPVVTVK